MLKLSEILSYEKAWRKLKCIFLSERTPPEKDIYRMIPNILQKRQNLRRQ